MLQVTVKYRAIVLMFLLYAEVANAKRICPQNIVTSSAEERTFPSFYDLFGNGGGNSQDNPVGDLKNVYADECDVIEEYENGPRLTTETPKDNNPDNKFFLGLLWNLPHILFHKHTTRVPWGGTDTTARPTTTTKPSSSGEIFGNNPVLPPILLTPSDEIKPVYEYADDVVKPISSFISNGEHFLGFSLTKPTLPPTKTESTSATAEFSLAKLTSSSSDAASTTATSTTENSGNLMYTRPTNILRSYFRYLFT